MLRNIMFVLGCLFAFLPYIASAHEPEPGEFKTVVVSDPEVAQVYESVLKGEAHVYEIASDKPFILSLGIFIPDEYDHKRDIMAAVLDLSDPDVPIAILDGMNGEWIPVYEETTGERYYHGPMFSSQLTAGSYEIRVWSSNNDSSYSLLIGENDETVSAPVGSNDGESPTSNDFIETSIFATVVSASISAIFGMLWMMKRRETQTV